MWQEREGKRTEGGGWGLPTELALYAGGWGPTLFSSPQTPDSLTPGTRFVGVALGTA